MIRRLLAVSSAVLVSSGCSPGAGEVAETPRDVRRYARSDSASVTIVKSAEPQFSGAESWRIRAEPTATFGYDDDLEKGLGRAGWAVALGKDRIAAIDYSENRIKVLSPGSLTRAMGGTGEGPGEFRTLFQLWRLDADSLLAYDQALKRLSIWTSDGTLAGMVRLVGAGPPPRLVGLLPGGDLVGLEIAPPSWESPTGTITTLDETFVRIGRDGMVRDTFASFTGDVIRMFKGPDGRPAYGPEFEGFQPQNRWTVGNGHLYHGFAGRNEIRVVHPEDGLVRLIRWGDGPSPVTRELVTAYEEEMRDLASARSQASSSEMERRLASAEYPDAVPAFDWLLVDTPGNLWVRHYRLPGGGEATWSVFDSDGVWIVDLSLPLVGMGRPAVFDIGHDYVLIREEDGAGLQYYARYELIKGG